MTLLILMTMRVNHHHLPRRFLTKENQSQVDIPSVFEVRHLS
jgi:hypothetical protein